MLVAIYYVSEKQMRPEHWPVTMLAPNDDDPKARPVIIRWVRGEVVEAADEISAMDKAQPEDYEDVLNTRAL